VVTIKGDELFASGSASIDARYIPVVQRVAQALNNVPGPVIVTGHTDDVPIRTARFPSNWELSRERALSVAKLMAGDIADKERLRTEGLADSEPLAPNDSAANRAKNRRVTVILKVLRAQ
jgi:type VI secretion system protein ImpK